MPTSSANLRAIASYSSGLTARSSGISTRRRGPTGVCFRVLYTHQPQPSPCSRSSRGSVPYACTLSMSSVMISRLCTAFFLRRPPISFPATNPPQSFLSSCMLFGSRRYSASFSAPLRGVCRRCHSSPIVVICGCHAVSLRLLPVLISICLSCASVTVSHLPAFAILDTAARAGCRGCPDTCRCCTA